MITIGVTSRQTCITAATLRKWEARYGFPVPVRTAGGQRAFYAPDLKTPIEISRRVEGVTVMASMDAAVQTLKNTIGRN